MSLSHRLFAVLALLTLTAQCNAHTQEPTKPVILAQTLTSVSPDQLLTANASSAQAGETDKPFVSLDLDTDGLAPASVETTADTDQTTQEVAKPHWLTRVKNVVFTKKFAALAAMGALSYFAFDVMNPLSNSLTAYSYTISIPTKVVEALCDVCEHPASIFDQATLEAINALGRTAIMTGSTIPQAVHDAWINAKGYAMSKDQVVCVLGAAYGYSARIIHIIGL